jgi:hypothetical protein
MLYLDVNGMLYPVTLLPEIVKGVVSFVLYAILNCQDIESGPFSLCQDSVVGLPFCDFALGLCFKTIFLWIVIPIDLGTS